MSETSATGSVVSAAGARAAAGAAAGAGAAVAVAAFWTGEFTSASNCFLPVLSRAGSRAVQGAIGPRRGAPPVQRDLEVVVE